MFHHYFFNQGLVILLVAMIAAFIGHFLVDLVVGPRREKIKDAIKKRGIEDIYEYTDDITKPIGRAERALYVLTICFGHPEFIAVWLALKTAVHWRAWSDNKNGKKNDYGDALSRAIFNLFVLGNAMSLLAAVLILVFASLFFPIFYGFH
jgi:hypothetical protein